MDTNYTTKSQEAISGAMQAAAAAGNPQIEPAHLLVELLAQPDDVSSYCTLLNARKVPTCPGAELVDHRPWARPNSAVLSI